MPRARPERHLSVSRLVWHFAPGEGRKKRFGFFNGSLTRRFPSAETPPGNPAEGAVEAPNPERQSGSPVAKSACVSSSRPRRGPTRTPPPRSTRPARPLRSLSNEREVRPRAARLRARRDARVPSSIRASKRSPRSPSSSPPDASSQQASALHPSDIPLPPPPPPPRLRPQTHVPRRAHHPRSPLSRHVRVRGRSSALGGAAPPLPPAVLSKRPAPRRPRRGVRCSILEPERAADVAAGCTPAR